MRLFAAMIGALFFCSAYAEELQPGTSTFGRHHFIEYIPGDLPLIIAAPHGGHLMPSEIPDRTNGVVDTDANTQELAHTIASVIHTETGRHIHLVICHLHRSKLDANRELAEAARVVRRRCMPGRSITTSSVRPARPQ